MSQLCFRFNIMRYNFKKALGNIEMCFFNVQKKIAKIWVGGLVDSCRSAGCLARSRDLPIYDPCFFASPLSTPGICLPAFFKAGYLHALYDFQANKRDVQLYVFSIMYVCMYYQRHCWDIKRKREKKGLTNKFGICLTRTCTCCRTIAIKEDLGPIFDFFFLSTRPIISQC